MQLTSICYIRKNGKTLMLHRVKKENDISKDKWLGLGGKFEDAETPEECIIREVEEESGLIIKNPKLCGIITYPQFDGEHDEMMFLFTADEFDGKIIDSDEGMLEWVNNDKIQDLNIWEGDKLFFKWLEDEKFFSAKMVYENGELKSYQVVFY